MWPWGHLGFAYLLYSPLYRLRHRTPPTWTGMALLVVGSHAPDLIDKPLAWTLHVLPTGRSFAHSLILGTAIVVVVVVALGRLDLPGWPFAFGYYTHLVGDSVRPALDGRFHDLAFLLWPVVSQAPPTEPKAGILPYLLDARLEGTVVVDLGLAGVAFALWLLEGTPGARGLWNSIHGRVGRSD